MLKNYFKLAWRNIIRHKINTVVNVTGLALGITCCLFIFLWVRDEKSVDNFHKDEKNLYTIYETVSAASVSVIVALLTMGYQAVKAAVANPIKGLRAE